MWCGHASKYDTAIAVLYLLHLVQCSSRVRWLCPDIRYVVWGFLLTIFGTILITRAVNFLSSVVLFPTLRRVSATLRLYEPLAYLFSLLDSSVSIASNQISVDLFIIVRSANYSSSFNWINSPLRREIKKSFFDVMFRSMISKKEFLISFHRPRVNMVLVFVVPSELSELSCTFPREMTAFLGPVSFLQYDGGPWSLKLEAWVYA